MFYANRQKEKEKLKRDFIQVSDDQYEEIQDILQILDKNENPFGQTDYESEFMKAYQQNLLVNAQASQEDKEIQQIQTESPMEEVKITESLRTFRQNLPSFAMKNEIVQTVRENNVVVISGETGCGKTTQVPQYLFEDCKSPQIVCTQPRRISAISVAHRVAEELGEKLGKSVGYQIRLESVLPRSQKGSILFCTTGIVLQWMIKNPLLSHVTHLIVDEIHERDLQSDFILTLLKDLLQKRPNLKVILMSATLNAQAFSKYFFGCPILKIPGFTYPVKEFYLEDVLEMTRFDMKFPPDKPAKVWQHHTKKGKDKFNEMMDYQDMIGPYIRNEMQGKYSRATIEILRNKKSEELNHDLVSALVHHLHVEQDDLGAILVFLPGWEDISKVHTNLSQEGSRYFLHFAKIFPLHSMMPTSDQREIFQKPPENTRKIILATNIAETSITIDDVVFVVNCGKVKMTKFDTKANLSTFKAEWVSLANSKQRRGRAGRVKPGICYHLYSKPREMILDSFMLPEIQRKRLEEVILQIKVLGLGNVNNFLGRVMDPPEKESIDLSLDLLRSLNAINTDQQLTPLGFHLAQLPMDPQTGKMILLGAIFSCLDPVLSVAASLSFKDAFVVPLGKEEIVDKIKRKLAGESRSDHFLMANVMLKWENSTNPNEFCYRNFLSESTLKMLHVHKKQFAQHLHEMNFIQTPNIKDSGANKNSGNEALVRAVICAGLYPNVAMLKNLQKDCVILRTHQENHVELHLKSVNSKCQNFKYQWMVFHMKMKSGKVNLYDSSMVSPLSLVFFGKNLNHGVDIINGLEIDLIAVDRMIKFHCDKRTYLIVKKLKEGLNQFLAYKVANPEFTDWSSQSREASLLKAIAKLLTFEIKVVNSEIE